MICLTAITSVSVKVGRGYRRTFEERGFGGKKLNISVVNSTAAKLPIPTPPVRIRKYKIPLYWPIERRKR